ncbi:conserved hypothetical protein [Neospora caninum Liverpool]|uniref:Uncharacterized protein n=1 Tax=Neospora caninum (strain Liverpool) TaxID=572307 RepID=F0VA51_NEOCL|nr:conserved hypothetical protein [Neospora caninum Liverpool]CBZ50540.1 conserved hypothetical protein [Neospora caninum Liverpool]|eukprot:XP_003880573.1 conserved hypothetical protein [Neospora caninum Liverpool]
MDEANLPAAADSGQTPVGPVPVAASGPCGDGYGAVGAPHNGPGVSGEPARGSFPSPAQGKGDTGRGVSVGAVDSVEIGRETEALRGSGRKQTRCRPALLASHTEDLNTVDASSSSPSMPASLENSGGVHTPQEGSRESPGSSGGFRGAHSHARPGTLPCEEERRFLVPLPSGLARFSHRLSSSGRIQEVKTQASLYAGADANAPSPSSADDLDRTAACFSSASCPSVAASAVGTDHASSPVADGQQRPELEGKEPGEAEERQLTARTGPTSLKRREATKCLSVGFAWARSHPWGLEVLLTEQARDRALESREKGERQIATSPRVCTKESLSVSPVDCPRTPKGGNEPEEGRQGREEAATTKQTKHEREEGDLKTKEKEQRHRDRTHLHSLVHVDATSSFSSCALKTLPFLPGVSAVFQCLPREENASWLPPCRAFGDQWEAAVNPDFCQLAPCCAATSFVSRATLEKEPGNPHPSSPSVSAHCPSQHARGTDSKQGVQETKRSSEKADSLAAEKTRASRDASVSRSLASSASSRSSPAAPSSGRTTRRVARPATVPSFSSWPCCVRRIRFFLPEHLALQDLLPSLQPSSAALGAASPLSPHLECLEKTRKAAGSDGASGGHKDAEGAGVKVHNQLLLAYVVADGRSFAGMGYVPALCTCPGKNYFRPWLLQRHRALERERQWRHSEQAQREAGHVPKTRTSARGEGAKKTPAKKGEGGERPEERGEEHETAQDSRKEDPDGAEKPVPGKHKGHAEDTKEHPHAPDQSRGLNAVGPSARPSRPLSSQAPALPSACPSCQGLLFVPYSLIEVPLVRGVESLSTLAESVAFPSKTELFSGSLRHTAVVVCTNETHERLCWRALKQANLHRSSVVFDVDARGFVPFHSGREGPETTETRETGRNTLSKEQVQLNEHLAELQHVGEEASTSSAALFVDDGEQATKAEKKGEAREKGSENAESSDNAQEGSGDLEDALASAVFAQEKTEGRERISSFSAERRPLEVTLRCVGRLGKKQREAERKVGRSEAEGASGAGKDEASGRQTAAGDGGAGGEQGVDEIESCDDDPQVGLEDAEDDRLLLLHLLATRLLAEEEGELQGEGAPSGREGAERAAREESSLHHRGGSSSVCTPSRSRAEATPTAAGTRGAAASTELPDGEEPQETQTSFREHPQHSPSHTAPSASPSLRVESTGHRRRARETHSEETGTALERAGKPGFLQERELLSLVANLLSPESAEEERRVRRRKTRRERLDAQGRRPVAGLCRAPTDSESEREDAEKREVNPTGKATKPEAGGGEKRQNLGWKSSAGTGDDRRRLGSVSSEPRAGSTSPWSSGSSPSLSPKATTGLSPRFLLSPSLASPYSRLGGREESETAEGATRREKRGLDRETRSMRESYCRRRGLIWGEEQEQELTRLENFFRNDPHISHLLLASSAVTEANGVTEKTEEDRTKRQKTRGPLPIVPPGISRQVCPPKPPLSSFSASVGEGGIRRAGGQGELETAELAHPAGSGSADGGAEPVVLLPRKSFPYAQRPAQGSAVPLPSFSVDKEGACGATHSSVWEKTEELPGGAASSVCSLAPGRGLKDACGSVSHADSGMHMSSGARRETERGHDAGRGVSFYSETGKITLLPNTRQKTEQSPMSFQHKGREQAAPLAPQSVGPFGVNTYAAAAGEERRPRGTEGEEEAKKELEQQRQQARLMRQHPNPNLRNF